MKYFYLVILIILMGCGQNSDVIKPVASTKGGIISIVEIEGHKYITVYNGGTVHAESCVCKSNLIDKFPNK